MFRRPTSPNRTDRLFPYTALVRTPSSTRLMLEQAGRLGPSVPIITARVASGSPLASLALSAGGAGCEQPASASASVGRRRAGRCRGRRVIVRKSTRLTPVTNAHLVCRLLLENQKTHQKYHKK